MKLTMARLLSPALLVAITMAAATAETQNRPTRFWNLTKNTISELRLAPAGTTNWGPDQCKNDKDGTVETDERLRISGVASGHYDAKFSDVTGRKCTVRDLKIEAGAVFAIEEKDLASCDR
jgi:hypothetical protein